MFEHRRTMFCRYLIVQNLIVRNLIVRNYYFIFFVNFFQLSRRQLSKFFRFDRRENSKNISSII